MVCLWCLARHHTPQAKNIPCQPLLIKPIFSVLAHAEKTVFFFKTGLPVFITCSEISVVDCHFADFRVKDARKYEQCCNHRVLSACLSFLLLWKDSRFLQFGPNEGVQTCFLDLQKDRDLMAWAAHARSEIFCMYLYIFCKGY